MKNENTELTSIDAEKISTRVVSRKKGGTTYRENPFWRPCEIKIGTKRITIAGGLVASPDSGESIKHAGVHRIEYVDEEKFVKLFTQNLRIFFNLSSASQKLLQFILVTLQKRKNEQGIWINWIDVEDFSIKNNLKISRTTFHRGLNEMLVKGFVAESERPNYFWINPHLFFNGDRMIFINDYRKKSIKKIKEDMKKIEE